MGYDFATREDTAYTNTPEQRVAALTTVKRFTDSASLPELVAMLGLGGTRD